MSINPADLTQQLIRCASVTPADEGAIPLLQKVLTDAGFETFRADRADIVNLVARFGPKGHAKTFGFNGHTDVVPTGDPADWTHDPFGATIEGGTLFGRGAADMKSGVAAFVAAAIDLAQSAPPDGAIMISITGDEEGASRDGTRAILDWMDANGETMDVCLVGEPTCPNTLGDTIKIGRRGSMTAYFTATGVQGHSAYPLRAKNPLPALVRLMDRLASHALDTGTDHFDASTLAVTTFDTGNPANNVIPATCRATINIRFNDSHSSATLTDWLTAQAAAVAGETDIDIAMKINVSGESFVTPPGALSDLVANAITAVTGITPELSTTGGTSDARFVKSHCPVVEFGLVGQTMHQIDERVEIADIYGLKTIYTRILTDYFAS